MSHLHMGSHRNWAELRRQLRTEARPDAVLAGDMNTWGPLVHLFMPGWHEPSSVAPGPGWNPTARSTTSWCEVLCGQLDGVVLPDAGSDHRPVRAEIAIG